MYIVSSEICSNLPILLPFGDRWLGQITIEIIEPHLDAVTKPAPEMRLAIAESEYGYDLFGDYGTINCSRDSIPNYL